MELNSYTLILHYLRDQKRGISPTELSTVLGRSRVTIQSSLKRLVKNGWITKEGESPKTFYTANELSIVPRETLEKEQKVLIKPVKPVPNGLLEQFIFRSNKGNLQK